MSNLCRSSEVLGVERTAAATTVPSAARWTALCAGAEAVGMTAAALAAKTSQVVAGERSSVFAAFAALSLVVAGGLVEGIALGTAQAAGLRRWLPRLDRRRWVLVTVAVAGIGWAAASAPAALSGGQEGAPPPWPLLLAGAAVLGALMGAALGAAQALVLRGHVAHPWRWVGANAVAWAPAMAVIFLGASTPGADWPVAAVAGLGAVTGLAAGTVLGLASGWFLPSLAGSSPHSRVVLAVLGSPTHRLLDRSLVTLRLRGAVSGRVFEMPAMYATDRAGMVILPGRPDTKRWWRNLRRPAAMEVLLRGSWRPAVGVVLQPGAAGYDDAVATYSRRWPRVRAVGTGPVVRIGVQETPAFLG